MTGCRHNAKNTLVKNYLYLAEQDGAGVLPLTTVTRVRPRAERRLRGDAQVHQGEAPRRTAGTRSLTADQVVFAAASLGTQRLLHRMKAEGHLPRLSDRLGHLTRTNSESILGAIAPDTTIDYSHGVAITSRFHPDADTHVEPVRYGKGSNVMALLQTVLTDGDGDAPALADLAAGAVAPEGATSATSTTCKHWSERTVIALVMQSARQLDHDLHRPHAAARTLARSPPRRATASPTRPGSRSATRPCGGWPSVMGGTPGGSIGEPFNTADDRALHRRLHDRRLARRPG